MARLIAALILSISLLLMIAAPIMVHGSTNGNGNGIAELYSEIEIENNTMSVVNQTSLDTKIDDTISLLVRENPEDTNRNMERLIFLLEEKYDCGPNTNIIEEDHCAVTITRGGDGLEITITFPLAIDYGRPVEEEEEEEEEDSNSDAGASEDESEDGNGNDNNTDDTGGDDTDDNDELKLFGEGENDSTFNGNEGGQPAPPQSQPEPEIQPSVCLPSFGPPSFCGEQLEFLNNSLPTPYPIPEPTDKCATGPMKAPDYEEACM